MHNVAITSTPTSKKLPAGGPGGNRNLTSLLPEYGRRRNAFAHLPHSAAMLLGSLLVVVQQAEDVVLLKALASLQKVELHGEGQAGYDAAQLLHQLHGGLHGAAGSQ